MNIENQTVLVTGANRGIGKSIVDELLNNGVKKVYAGARKVSSLPQWNDDRVVALELDITNDAQVKAATEAAGDINILINNAGVATFASFFDDNGVDATKRDMDTNFWGTLNMMRSFVPVLEKNTTPTIVNVVTIGAFVNFPSIGGYSASKAALFSLSQGARMELAGKGIAVHTVNPGPIDTDMAKEFDIDKTSPQVTAQNIIAGMKADQADIFPDPGGQGMFEVWKKDYRELEAMVGSMG